VFPALPIAKRSVDSPLVEEIELRGPAGDAEAILEVLRRDAAGEVAP
jgi:hypothetical protein